MKTTSKTTLQFLAALLMGLVPFSLVSCEKETVVTEVSSSSDDEGDKSDPSDDGDEEEDDGTGEYTIPDTGDTDDSDDSDNDYVGNSTFDRTISVTFSKSGDATVSGDDSSEQTVSVSGNDVTITNNGEERVIYELSGSTSDGFFKLYSSRKQAIKLNGVSITNPAGSAINNQSGKRTFVIVEGTNTLADGSSYSDETDSEDMKAAFFSEGQLVFSGDGSLTVTAKGKAGITSDDYVRFMASPTVKVTSSAGHGVRGKDAITVTDGTLDVSTSATAKKGFSSDGDVTFEGGSTTITVTGSAGTVDGELTGTAGIKVDGTFTMSDGSLTIKNSGKGGKGINGDGLGYFKGGTVSVTTTGSNYGSSSGGWGGSSSSSSSASAKGVKFDGNVEVSGGEIVVKCSSHEGFETKGTLKVSGGSLYSYASDDAINSSGDMTISGGYVCAYSTGNDGLDANGNLYLKGGVIYAVGASSPEVAIDANTEGGKTLYVQGGTIITFGGLESGASISQALVSSSSWSKNTNYALYDGSTLLMTFKSPSSGGSGMVLSHGSLKSGTSYTLKSGVTVSGGTSYLEGLYTEDASVSGGSSSSVSASTSSGSTGGGPGGGGGGGRW